MFIPLTGSFQQFFSTESEQIAFDDGIKLSRGEGSVPGFMRDDQAKTLWRNGVSGENAIGLIKTQLLYHIVNVIFITHPAEVLPIVLPWIHA